MAQHFGDNPQVLTLLNALQQPGDASVEAAPENEDKVRYYQQKLEQADKKISRLRKVAHELERALQALEQTQANFAYALGACAFCWGEDPHCRACRGRGAPGAFELDVALFEELILPALRRYPAPEQLTSG